MKLMTKIAVVTASIALMLWRDRKSCPAEIFYKEQRANQSPEAGAPALEKKKAATPLQKTVDKVLVNTQKARDLKRFGTREGVIDVAKDRDENERLKIAKRQQSEKIKHARGVRDKRFLQREKDLKKYGTRQGVIDVADDTHREKKDKQLLKRLSDLGERINKEHLKEEKQQRKEKERSVNKHEYSGLWDNYHKLSVVIRNESDHPHPIELWKGAVYAPPIAEDVEDHSLLTTISIPAVSGSGNHPQGVKYNPVNGYTYVANQLSDNVSVFDKNGNLISLIQLQPSALPGLNSPVAIAVNDKPGSPTYGYTYVVGSVADTVSVIDLSFNVVAVVNISGTRGMDIAFNPVNEQLYVSQLMSSNCCVIDAVSFMVTTTLVLGANPRGVGVNTNNGDVYVTNIDDNTISVYNASNTLQATIAGLNSEPVCVSYHPVNDKMYVVCRQGNFLYPINTSTYTPEPPIAVGNNPYTVVYNSFNSYLYVGNRDDDSITILKADESIKDTINVCPVDIGFDINQQEGLLYLSEASSNQVSLVGYLNNSSHVFINSDYFEDQRIFRGMPAIVKHTKWSFSTTEVFKVLTHLEQQPTGKRRKTPVSMLRFEHPHKMAMISEVTALEGSLIDHKNSWSFIIHPFQTISILIYYKQIKAWDFTRLQSWDKGCEPLRIKEDNEKLKRRSA